MIDHSQHVTSLLPLGRFPTVFQQQKSVSGGLRISQTESPSPRGRGRGCANLVFWHFLHKNWIDEDGAGVGKHVHRVPLDPPMNDL